MHDLPYRRAWQALLRVAPLLSNVFGPAQKFRPCHKPASCRAKSPLVPHVFGGGQSIVTAKPQISSSSFESYLAYSGKACGTSADFARRDADLWHERRFCTARRRFVARTAILHIRAASHLGVMLAEAPVDVGGHKDTHVGAHRGNLADDRGRNVAILGV